MQGYIQIFPQANPVTEYALRGCQFTILSTIVLNNWFQHVNASSKNQSLEEQSNVSLKGQKFPSKVQDSETNPMWGIALKHVPL